MKNLTAWMTIGLLTITLLAGQARAGNNFYVATNGNDTTGNGSLSNPYQTIQKAANVAQGGDNVYVRGGTYRETVTLSHGGSSGSPISFQPYNNEQVTITGLDQLNSGWTQYSGSIWQNSNVTAASQVFLGGQVMTEARSTNSGYNNPLRRTYSTVDSATNPASGLSTITSSALNGTPDGTWNGAKVAFLGGPQYGTSTATIVGQVGNTISYQSPGEPSYAQPRAGNPFYLYGSLAAVDAPKEWYYNASASQLYLQAPNGAAPNGQNVEVRTRQNGFDLSSQSYVNISGFKLQAATINVAGNHNLIDNCQILYPTPSTDTQMWDRHSGVVVSGQYNTIRHSEIGYSWGDGVTLSNSNNTVENNAIHDCNEGGTYGSCVNTDAAGNNTIQNNTMYNSGRYGVLSGVNVDTPNNQILHNDISRFGYLTKDLGGIDTSSSNGTGTVVAYNKIHDCYDTSGYGTGVYLDDYTSGVTVHHNLVTNTTIGVYAKGDSQNVYNNTLWGIGSQAVYCFDTYSNITTVNNLSNQNGFDGTNVSNNRYQTVNQFTNSAAGDYTLTANSSGTTQGATRKRAVNYGVVIPGITDGYTGSAPDAGAFESGVTPWTAGANWKAWTAGNQATAPLDAALYVAQSGTRVTTGSLMVGNTTSTAANNRSFLHFDLSGIVSTTIQSAVLRIYENTPPTSAAGSVTLNRVTSAWTNSNASYNQSVDTVAPITGFYDPSNLDLYTDINITSWVQGWLSNSATNYGLRLCGTEDVVGTAKYFDGFYGVTAPQLVLTMPEPGDANLDGKVDVSDLAILAANYRKHVTGGWAQADFNNDGVVDVQDLAILAANYRYGVASDVVPAFDGLDPAAIELLSLAGVTMAPEPCTLIMLAVALIGPLAYACRKRG